LEKRCETHGNKNGRDKPASLRGLEMKLVSDKNWNGYRSRNHCKEMLDGEEEAVEEWRCVIRF